MEKVYVVSYEFYDLLVGKINSYRILGVAASIEKATEIIEEDLGDESLDDYEFIPRNLVQYRRYNATYKMADGPYETYYFVEEFNLRD